MRHLAVVSLATALATMPAYAAKLPGLFDGSAAVLKASAAGPVDVEVGSLPRIGCTCMGTNGTTKQRSLAGVSLAGLLSTGALQASSTSNKTTTTATNTQTASINKLSLFGGLITADAITASATASADSQQITTSTAGSSFVNLTVAGQPISPSTAPNTSIPLPGIGSVTIFASTQRGQGKVFASVSETVLQITVNVANAFLPVGAVVEVGQASAGYTRNQPSGLTSGGVYSVSVQTGIVGNAANLGPLGGLSMSKCTGTDGVTKTGQIAAVNAGPLSVGAGSESIFGGQSGQSTVSQTQVTLGAITLFGGLIGASGLTAEATDTLTGHTVTGSANGTTFADLVIAGVKVPANVPPNTSFALPLLGTVVVNEQTVPSGSGPVTVNGLHITVTSALNIYSLPVGTQIVVGHATASARPS